LPPDRTVVVIGLGGLGCPTLLGLVQTPGLRFVLVDDDVVDESNLGRQILYGPKDVGRPKTLAARDALRARGVPDACVELHAERFSAGNARDLVRGAAVVIEGTDDYGAKFLCADACALERVPVVHGAALSWRGTAFTVAAAGAPCYRCLFEDVPDGPQPNCSSAGVIGPVTGMVGAWLAEEALSVLSDRARFGQILSYDGLCDRLRRSRVGARPDCPLCGCDRSIFTVDERRYPRQMCAAEPRRSHAP
jgi:molybdopterin/thiamine biosynthesis adenylyltransferase